MKILFFGDSITDALRNRGAEIGALESYGVGYVRAIAGNLLSRNPKQYTIINSGISGDRIVDLYARIKSDVWNHEPYVLSILVGINDIWHEIGKQNGVDIVRFEKIYRLLLEDTIQRFPNMKIILCEPFVLEGGATKQDIEKFLEILKYAKVVEGLAKEFNLYFLPLQQLFNEKAKKVDGKFYLHDGVHPNIAGAQLIADKWLDLFDKEINDN